MRRIDAPPAPCNCLPADVQVMDTENGPRFTEGPTEAKGDGALLAAAIARADAEARKAAQAGPPACAVVFAERADEDERPDGPPPGAQFRR